jgi:hypothetical protein
VRVSNSLAATSPLRSGTSLKKLGEMSGERKAELAQADGPFKSMFCFMLNAEIFMPTFAANNTFTLEHGRPRCAIPALCAYKHELRPLAGPRARGGM